MKELLAPISQSLVPDLNPPSELPGASEGDHSFIDQLITGVADGQQAETGVRTIWRMFYAGELNQKERITSLECFLGKLPDNLKQKLLSESNQGGNRLRKIAKEEKGIAREKAHKRPPKSYRTYRRKELAEGNPEPPRPNKSKKIQS